eukprot:gene29643-35781_t
MYPDLQLSYQKPLADDWIALGCTEYEKRLSGSLKLQTVFLKSNEDLIRTLKEQKGVAICLDETGKQFTSEEFSAHLLKAYEEGGAQVTFVIGGHDGLPKELKTKDCISLSKMTWTHQMARLLLIEQIYRAFEIRKGSSYHR